MVEIEKGRPGPPRAILGGLVQELVETAFADKGEWYSAEQPSDVPQGSVHNYVNSRLVRLVAKVSTKNGRIWVRFHKDSDEPE